MRIAKKVLSMILACVMVLGLLPAVASASGQVYISVSFDGQYINGKNGSPMVYVPVSFDQIESIDLEEYGLGDYLYDPDGDGIYETTALQLIIYAHENIYGGSWSDVNFTGGAGSSYFQGGIFGFDENLNYFLNGKFPIDEALSEGSSFAVGATSDHIILEPGDFIDIASFTSYAFLWDSAAGFHLFADSNDNFVHSYAAEAGEPLPVKLLRSYSNMADGSAVLAAERGYELSYGAAYGTADGTATTDDGGCAEITFDQAGTYYLWCNGNYGIDSDPENIVSSPAYATVTVTAKPAETEPTETEPEETEPEQPRQPQSVSSILNVTMAKMAATVTAPVFGTTAGEWTVFGLARGGYYAKDSAYFADYYDRIVETVNTTAASVDLNGALHKSKSTDNSRLIVALSAIGKDATTVGDWNLVEAYSANGFSWIKKQGINGPIWALIALDSHNYVTSDTTIRQQCVDAIVAAQHDDGGWSLMANTALASDPDITGMALTALYPYRDQAAVAAACSEAIACLSAMQHDNGTFASGGAECSESCAWAIIGATAWGINPDTDERFIKNGKSAVDGLLAHYVEAESMFQHVIGGGANAMGTDQGCYGLVAYDRFMNGKAALYDYSDVTFDPPVTPEEPSEPTDPGDPSDPTDPTDPEEPEAEGMTATLGVPAEIEGTAGTRFNAIISINQWDNEAGYKLIDFIMTVPQGLSVTDVTAGSRLTGGEVSWNLEAETGKLRVVYFDANENNTLEISGTEFPAEVFTIGLKLEEAMTAGTSLDFTISGMSVKLTSDSEDEAAMVIVNTTNSDGTSVGGSSGVVTGISFSAVCLYEGDDVDLIPSTRKAVAVAVTGIAKGSKLSYSDGTNSVEFKYSAEITAKTGVSAYVALVDAAIEMENFVNKDYFTITSAEAETITFADANGDGVINAQDALAAVDTWLRKGEAPADDAILVLNVNGDSRINTFDALGIVEAFVNGTEYGVVTKAATITTKQ